MVVGLAVLGYALWIPVRHPAPGRVAALALTRPVQGLRPHPTTAESAPSASPLAAVSAAAATTPGQTAVETVSWKGTTKDTAAALVVLALPTVHDASLTRVQAEASYLSKTSLTSVGYGYGGPLTLPAVPGAKGASFVAGTSPTVTSSTRRTDAEVFALGRVVVVATAQGRGNDAKTRVDALAVAEYHHLRNGNSRPDLAETSFPLVASVVFAGAAAAVLAVTQLAPWALATVRGRRQAAWEEALRRERASRGSKVVKRRAGRPPPGRPAGRRAGGRRR